MTNQLTQLNAALSDRYVLQEELGRGGMATVYLAHDLKHDRMVAVKVLHPEVAAVLGAERFLKEIKVTANLQHPHILPLHDSGQADRFLYYVMPYVQGESLRQRLERENQLPLDEASHIAREVADALSYAHSLGVVHRDIKPENILLESGHAVVADFGIATAMSEVGPERLTETGMTLGTPVYMSPEQAAGDRDLDGRSDLYSLGCVLYEMIAGQPPFPGPTAESIIHQHLTVEPPSVAAIRPAVPAHLAGTIARALAKTPADRFSPVALFAEALKEPMVGVQPPTVARDRVRLFLGAAIVVVVALAAAIIWLQARRSEAAIVLPTPRQITFSGDILEAALSPDGQLLAYVTGQSGQARELFVRDVEVGQPILIHESEAFFCCPDWSSDGSQLLFHDGPRGNGTGVIVPRLGGARRRMFTDVIAIWSPDGSAIVSWWPQAQSLWRTETATGDTLASIPITGQHDWVSGVDWSPDGEWLAVITLLEGAYTLWTVALEGDVTHEVVEDTLEMLSPRWAPDGSAVYYLRRVAERDDELWKIRITGNGEGRGPPERVLSNLTIAVRSSAIPSISLAADGSRLLYNRLQTRSNLWLFELDPSASDGVREARELTTGTAMHETPRISPDGGRVVYLESAMRGSNVFTMALEDMEPMQLTFLDSDVWSPAWSPDGSLIAFGAMRERQPDVWVVPAAGGTPRPSSLEEFERGNLLAWSPGERLVYQRPGDNEYYTVDLGSDTEASLARGDLRGWAYDPRPAPGGERVAMYWNLGRSDSTGLWIHEMEAEPVLLAPHHSPIGWSADGGTLYAMPVRDRRSEGTEVHAFNMATGRSRLLATLPVAVMPWNASVRHDGRTLVAAVEERQTDAWVVDSFDPTAR
jgi:serine/threonine-protein kinase